MERIRVDPLRPAEDALARAAQVLSQGGVVAFPSETVYGLAVDARNPAAVQRLRRLKQRPPDQPIGLLIADRSDLKRPLPPLAQRIADRFWPGPVTLVVPDDSGSTVGLRLSSHPVARGLARAAGTPLAQTSANRAGAPEALDADGVAAAFRSADSAVDLLLDAGTVSGGMGSTVVACTARRFRILREGALAADEIVDAASRLILFACTGNICRSPVAEALMRAELADRTGCEPKDLVWHGFRCGSCGTMAMVGYPASEHSVTVADEMGLDIRSHRSRPWSIGLLESAFRVFCLAASHRDFLSPYFTDRPEALLLLRDRKDIRDPYGRSLRIYRKVMDQIRSAGEKRAEELSSGD